MLGTFWGDDDTAAEIRAIELESWLDTLGAMTCDQFRAAWIEYQRTGPRTAKGRLYKPDAGAIWKLAHEKAVQPISADAPSFWADAPSFWADKIKAGRFVSQMAMTESMIQQMLARGLVTREQLRERGIR